jgi:hypothetical protein
MIRANGFAQFLVLGLVMAWSMFALAWGGSTDRRVIEDAARYFPIERYEAAIGLARLMDDGAPELRVWRAGAGEVLAEVQVARPGGLASFGLYGEAGKVGAVASMVERDGAVGVRLERVLADLAALEPMGGGCGWAEPEVEIEAVWRGERMHFRVDAGCVREVQALAAVMALVGG